MGANRVLIPDAAANDSMPLRIRATRVKPDHANTDGSKCTAQRRLRATAHVRIRSESAKAADNIAAGRCSNTRRLIAGTTEAKARYREMGADRSGGLHAQSEPDDSTPPVCRLDSVHIAENWPGRQIKLPTLCRRSLHGYGQESYGNQAGHGQLNRSLLHVPSPRLLSQPYNVDL